MYIRNRHIQNYLGERGIYPTHRNYYKKTAKLLYLLDCYEIEFFCIPNKL